MPAPAGSWHGGPTMQGGVPGDHWYKHRDGILRNGLTVFTYNLAPARKGDGGFACIPGTHKTNFLNGIPRDVRAFERSAHYVVQPEVEADARHRLPGHPACGGPSPLCTSFCFRLRRADPYVPLPLR